MENQRELTIVFTETELAQIHLCLINRIGGLASLWANSPNEELQQSYQRQSAFLEILDQKVRNALEGQKNEQ